MAEIASQNHPVSTLHFLSAIRPPKKNKKSLYEIAGTLEVRSMDLASGKNTVLAPSPLS